MACPNPTVLRTFLCTFYLLSCKESVEMIAEEVWSAKSKLHGSQQCTLHNKWWFWTTNQLEVAKYLFQKGSSILTKFPLISLGIPLKGDYYWWKGTSVKFFLQFRRKSQDFLYSQTQIALKKTCKYHYLWSHQGKTHSNSADTMVINRTLAEQRWLLVICFFN